VIPWGPWPLKEKATLGSNLNQCRRLTASKFRAHAAVVFNVQFFEAIIEFCNVIYYDNFYGVLRLKMRDWSFGKEKT